MTTPDALPSSVLRRRAVVYVRQSSQSQVQNGPLLEPDFLSATDDEPLNDRQMPSVQRMPAVFDPDGAESIC